MRLLFAAILLGFVASTAAPAAGNDGRRSIKLSPGETRVIDVADAAQVNVSRRGIIHLRFLGDHRWEINALRTGVVMVEVTPATPPTERAAIDTSFMVEVLPRDAARPTRDQIRSAAETTGQFCGLSGIECIEPDIHTGVATDHRIWLAARESCLNRSSCRFHTRLSDAARSTWQKEITEQIAKHFQLLSSSNDLPIIVGSCSPSELAQTRALANHLTGGAESRGEILLHCGPLPEDHRQATPKRIKAWIIVVQRGTTQTSGNDAILSGAASLASTRPGIVSSASFSARLASMLSTHAGRTLGSPVVTLARGRETTAATGGEFRVMYNTDQGEGRDREGWKSWGISFAATLIGDSVDAQNVAYRLELRSRGSATDVDSLATANLTGETVITRDHVTLAGTIDLDATTESTRSPGILASIPIIGPLVQLQSSETSATRLELWIGPETASGPEAAKSE